MNNSYHRRIPIRRKAQVPDIFSRLAPLPRFSSAHLAALCQALTATADGLGGWEITCLLVEAKIADIDSLNTKWKRLHSALVAQQNVDGNKTRSVAFIALALDPARYIGRRELLERRRAAAKEALDALGVELKVHDPLDDAAPAQVTSGGGR